MSSDREDDHDTNDCPICLCPLTSPWGVCTPCGHAYCRGCWDQLAAASSHCAALRNSKNKPCCAVCKAVCKQFIPVFVDLQLAAASARTRKIEGGTTAEVAPAADAGHTVSTASQQDATDDNNDNNEDEKMDKLTNEWDALLKELEMLLNCKENEEEENYTNNNHFISRWDHNGQREVAAICANFIDPTQSPDDGDDFNKYQVPISSRKLSRKQCNKRTSSSQEEEEEEKQEALHQKELITHTIRRFKQLHCEMMQLQLHTTRRSPQQTQKLRSKIISLQSSKAELSSQLHSQQIEITNLTERLEVLRKVLTERSVETEREKRNADKIKVEFNLMQESYQKHVSKSTIETNTLKANIIRLQDHVTKLLSESRLQDLHEIEEIRINYGKMSQDVHSLRAENVKLMKRLEDERTACQREIGRVRAKCREMIGEAMTSKSDELEKADEDNGGGRLASVTRENISTSKSHKVSLDNVSGIKHRVSDAARAYSSSNEQIWPDGGLDQRALLASRNMSSAAAASEASSSKYVNIKAASVATIVAPKSQVDPPKSKAMDILDSARSRKHSLNQSNLLKMSVKRTKKTSFSKESRKNTNANNAAIARCTSSSSGILHPFFARRNEGR